MALYLISYDLGKSPPEGYERLEKRLKGLSAHQVLYSQWAVKYASTAENLTQDILNYINPEVDTLLVTPILSEQSTWRNLLNGDVAFENWLRDE